MIEIKTIELADGSCAYDLRIITDHEEERQIAIACPSAQHAVDLKLLLDEAISIELM